MKRQLAKMKELKVLNHACEWLRFVSCCLFRDILDVVWPLASVPVRYFRYYTHFVFDVLFFDRCRACWLCTLHGRRRCIANDIPKTIYTLCWVCVCRVIRAVELAWTGCLFVASRQILHQFTLRFRVGSKQTERRKKMRASASTHKTKRHVFACYYFISLVVWLSALSSLSLSASHTFRLSATSRLRRRPLNACLLETSGARQLKENLSSNEKNRENRMCDWLADVDLCDDCTSTSTATHTMVCRERDS